VTVRYQMHLTPGDDAEVVAARLWAAGALGLQELHDGVVAWFPARADAVPPGGTWSVEPERDWLSSWREDLDVVVVGRVHVTPSWISHVPDGGGVLLRLDPGVAFGSGHHATTSLCLLHLQDLLEPGASVLDVGTGTGILAIAAALLGAGDVVAVDLDPQAVDACRRNAEANDVTVDVVVGSVQGQAPVDLLLANLLTPTLHALTDELVAATRPGGHLVLSGVASERAAGVAGAVTAAGAPLERRSDEDGWAALVHRRPPA
jgi:ribosomal protein L11 methyltransferase